MKDLMFYAVPPAVAAAEPPFFAVHNTDLHDSPAADVTTPPPNA